jgi:hypothetical protein
VGGDVIISVSDLRRRCIIDDFDPIRSLTIPTCSPRSDGGSAAVWR